LIREYEDPGGQPGDVVATRALDLVVAVLVGIFSLPLVSVIAVAIKVDSRGPVFFRCRRVGHRGTPFGMLKFRKMVDGAGGPGLTALHDDRLTRVGRLLAHSKLDELPQLWNVVRGQMSLVGPRPEDPRFVETQQAAFAPILEVKPGMTGLSQLAFARESSILDPDDRVGDYLHRILPQKMALDALYARRRTVGQDVRILWWTAIAVLGRRDVAVHRITGRPGLRRRPPLESAPVARAGLARMEMRS
jgi:lipopolysaccharide/colanic/teichoic acid biosynthesis glycosyltransferase